MFQIQKYILLFCLICIWGCNDASLSSSPTTLFTLLPSSHTNITFANDLTYTEEFNPYTYRNFYNGGGVGLGDINNDGLLDIFFCGNQVHSRLYLNKGKFQFEDITEKAGVACAGVWASGVSFVDINGDGLQDIYICKSGKPGGDNRYNELFINQGDLTFKASAKSYGLDNTGLSTHAAFFDYDRDGDLDCYLLNNSIRTVGAYDLRKNQRQIIDSLGGNKLMRNDDGHFANVSKAAGIYSSAIGFGLGVSVGDLNSDTWPDLYVSNDFFERDYLYLNQQDGTFKESIETCMSELSLNSMGADMADINNDGLSEIFVTDMLPETDARYKTKTTFENWEKYQRNVQNGYHHQFIRNALQWNRGNMHFSEISRFAGVDATDWSWGALIFDMDLDGHKDIFVANGIYKDLTDQDYLNLYNDPETILGLMKTEKNVIKKLIDAIPSEKIPNYAFHNRGNFLFENKAQDWGLATPSFSNGSAYGDLDNDGDLDLLINNTGMPCFVYQNNSIELQKGNYLRIELNGDSNNIKAIGSQITLYKGNQRFFQEVHPMRGFESCVDPRPLFGLGNIEELDSIRIIWPNGFSTQLNQTKANQTLRLSYDNRIEPLMNNPSYPTVSDTSIIIPTLIAGLTFNHTENTFNDFERDRLLFHMISREGPGIAVADINGDQLEDIFVGNALNASSALFLQNKDASFSKKSSSALESDRSSEDTDAAFFDADGDGDQDLYVCSGGNEVPSSSSLLADRLYINGGRGELRRSEQILPSFNFISSSCVKPCDYDQDGDIDLFVGERLKPFNYGVPCSGYLLNNDSKGIFTSVDNSDFKKIGLITDATWIDIDQDKDQDLIVVGEWMSITIFKNVKGKLSISRDHPELLGSTGLWQSIAAMDIDQDGDMDFIAANWGLNTRIKASPDQPAILYLNDFDQNGSADQILTTFNQGRSYPLTLRQDLLTQLPSLKKKYLKYENYKNQTITDIFDADQITSSIKLECKTNVTTLYLNIKGSFKPEPLPFEAQLSPTFSIFPMDMNGDDLQDILLGGNFSAVKPELGSYMSNPVTILIQRKDGSFQSMQHGLKSNEVRNMKSISIKNKKYVLLANNNGPLEVIAIKSK